MKTLILTPNKNLQCGMYQLAKDLAKEFDGDISTREGNSLFVALTKYNQVISLMYPMHSLAKGMKKESGTHWICYDQKIPPVTKTYFPNFWRRQGIRYINWRNNATMQGADEYWDVTEREQKPRWTKKFIHPKGTKVHYFCDNGNKIEITQEKYVIYLGRKTDYKNFDFLNKLMQKLKIPFLYFSNEVKDYTVWEYLSCAKMLVTASLWEGYGRPVMEAEALGIPAVAYDVGSHKRHIKKGICVHLDINNMQKSEEDFKKAVLKVWNK